MTVMEDAKKGKIIKEMKIVSKDEGQDVQSIKNKIAHGRLVVLKNCVRRNCHPTGIGETLSTKINANIGTSTGHNDVNLEIRKALVAVKHGADTIMDLSTAGNIDKIRRTILRSVNIPVGTVPIYQAAIEAIHKDRTIVDMTEDKVLNTIERHAKDGVDFMTIHAGVTMPIVDRLKKYPRIGGVVSRGGAFLAGWIIHNRKENPLYQNFDYILEIARKYDFCISLGDALRPGCLADSSDWYQLQELLTIGRLVEKCWKRNVQVIVEGPGHLPLNQIEANVVLEKTVCKGAPFYVLGPLVTDIGAGYDHIVGAIGGSIAASAGADFLCYVTPSEHLGLPSIDDVRNGVIASKLAAHCADVVKLGQKAAIKDMNIAKARMKLAWDDQYKFLIDAEKARKIRERSRHKTGACSMCGEYCVYKILSTKRNICF
ncbi:MAG: phosphomethylpyrimidine synthase ThiC [Candidatus Bathyarchaeota archaeon]